jgi:hypothetical protein
VREEQQVITNLSDKEIGGLLSLAGGAAVQPLVILLKSPECLLPGSHAAHRPTVVALKCFRPCPAVHETLLVIGSQAVSHYQVLNMECIHCPQTLHTLCFYV